MTKKTFIINLLFVASIILILLCAGILLSISDSSTNRIIYSTFKDLIPLSIAFIAAWLSYCIQRRSSFLQQLRLLWSRIVESIQLSIQYTQFEKPSKEQYLNVLFKLSISIDEIRGVFKNIKENNKDAGLYPFEPLKDIHGLISDLKYEKQFNKRSAISIKEKIFILWRDARKEILKEFDREAPTFPHSHWGDEKKCEIYEDNDIPKRPT